jgi:VIT1/CCC1 family predicted Fe2+/Mn2+ transporter
MLDQASGLSEAEIELAMRFCIDEYRDYYVYKKLAEAEKRGDLREALEKFSGHEYRHYRFWSSIAGDCSEDAGRPRVGHLLLMRKMLGLTFVAKYLERHESSVISEYRRFLERLDGPLRGELEAIIREEEEHESLLLSSLNESIVRYLGFIVLGLADAIVEITGVHAGFLGATTKTLIAGIAGLIVGISAAISMAGAAYLQAKAGEGETHPGRSALVTGVSYMLAVFVLALPYFVFVHQFIAFAVSVVLAVAMVTVFTFYGSVINDTNFGSDLAKNIGILFGTAAAAYVAGELLGSYFGIQDIFA